MSRLYGDGNRLGWEDHEDRTSIIIGDGMTGLQSRSMLSWEERGLRARNMKPSRTSWRLSACEISISNIIVFYQQVPKSASSPQNSDHQISSVKESLLPLKTPDRTDLALRSRRCSALDPNLPFTGISNRYSLTPTLVHRQ